MIATGPRRAGGCAARPSSVVADDTGRRRAGAAGPEGPGAPARPPGTRRGRAGPRSRARRLSRLPSGVSPWTSRSPGRGPSPRPPGRHRSAASAGRTRAREEARRGRRRHPREPGPLPWVRNSTRKRESGHAGPGPNRHGSGQDDDGRRKRPCRQEPADRLPGDHRQDRQGDATRGRGQRDRPGRERSAPGAVTVPG